MHILIYIYIHTYVYIWYTEVYTHTCTHARVYIAYSYTESDFLDAERKRGVSSATTSQPSHTLYFFVHVQVGGGWSGVGRHINCVCMCAVLSTQCVLYFQSSGQCGEASRQRAHKKKIRGGTAGDWEHAREIHYTYDRRKADISLSWAKLEIAINTKRKQERHFPKLTTH